MDQRIQQVIVDGFTNSTTRSQQSLLTGISEKLKVSPDDVLETILLMQDADQITTHGNSTTWRLKETATPSPTRFGRIKKWIMEHEILLLILFAGIGAISGIIGLIISIVILNR